MSAGTCNSCGRNVYFLYPAWLCAWCADYDEPAQTCAIEQAVDALKASSEVCRG